MGPFPPLTSILQWCDSTYFSTWRIAWAQGSVFLRVCGEDFEKCLEPHAKLPSMPLKKSRCLYFGGDLKEKQMQADLSSDKSPDFQNGLIHALLGLEDWRSWNKLGMTLLHCASCSHPVVYKNHLDLEMAHLLEAVQALQCFALHLSR